MYKTKPQPDACLLVVFVHTEFFYVLMEGLYTFEGLILPLSRHRYGITAAGVFPPISVVECLLQCKETENRALWLGCFWTEQQRQILYPQQNPPSRTRARRLLSPGSHTLDLSREGSISVLHFSCGICRVVSSPW